MVNIQLSIEELIFSFYSEGLYEQGISMKETYFPSLQDSELKLMLEFAARSMLAKNMVHEVNNQYKLKEEYAPFIHILSFAERTIKASKFDLERDGEESISFHLRNGEIYIHRLLHDHQVHYVSKIPEKQFIISIKEFFQFNKMDNKSEILYTIKNEEFEELLEDMSTSSSPTQLTIQKWIPRMQASFALEFLEDIANRKGKMDSLLSLKYDSENNPELIDLIFVIPGKSDFWLITRDQSLDLNIQKVSESLIKDLLQNKMAPFF